MRVLESLWVAMDKMDKIPKMKYFDPSCIKIHDELVLDFFFQIKNKKNQQKNMNS